MEVLVHFERLAHSMEQLYKLLEMFTYQPDGASITQIREPVTFVSQPHTPTLKSLVGVFMPIIINAVTLPALFPSTVQPIWPVSCSTLKTLCASCFYAVELDVVAPIAAFESAIITKQHSFQRSPHHRSG